VKMPLRPGDARAPEEREPRVTTGWPKRSVLKRAAGATAALLLVAGAGAASAIFVDYLADRAKLRAYAAATRNPAEATRPQDKAAAAVPVKTASAPKMSGPEAAPVKTAGTVETPGPEAAQGATSVALAAKAAAAEGELPAPAAVSGKVPATTGTAAPPEEALKAPMSSEPDPEAEEEIEPMIALSEDDPGDETLTGSIPTPRLKDDDAAPPSLPVDGEDDAAEKSAGRTAKVLKYVNLRSGPADESRVLTVVPALAKVNVLSCKSWCEVEYAGTKGFIYKRFIGNT